MAGTGMLAREAGWKRFGSLPAHTCEFCSLRPSSEAPERVGSAPWWRHWLDPRRVRKSGGEAQAEALCLAAAEVGPLGRTTSPSYPPRRRTRGPLTRPGASEPKRAGGVRRWASALPPEPCFAPARLDSPRRPRTARSRTPNATFTCASRANERTRAGGADHPRHRAGTLGKVVPGSVRGSVSIPAIPRPVGIHIDVLLPSTGAVRLKPAPRSPSGCRHPESRKFARVRVTPAKTRCTRRPRHWCRRGLERSSLAGSPSETNDPDR
jgi:hypothetical protein